MSSGFESAVMISIAVLCVGSSFGGVDFSPEVEQWHRMLFDGFDCSPLSLSSFSGEFMALIMVTTVISVFWDLYVLAFSWMLRVSSGFGRALMAYIGY